MGDVLAVFKVMPEDMDEYENLKERIKEAVSPVDMKDEPVAFGLKAILVAVRLPQDEKALQEVEEKIKSIKGVESVSLETSTLI